MQVTIQTPTVLQHASNYSFANIPDNPVKLRLSPGSWDFLCDQWPWKEPLSRLLVANLAAFGVCSTNALADLCGLSREQTLHVLEQCRGQYHAKDCLVVHGGQLRQSEKSKALICDYLPQSELWQIHPDRRRELAAMPFIPSRGPKITTTLPFSGVMTPEKSEMRLLPTTFNGVVQTHSILCSELIGALVRTLVTHQPGTQFMALSEDTLRKELVWSCLTPGDKKLLATNGQSWATIQTKKNGNTQKRTRRMDVPDGWLLALRPNEAEDDSRSRPTHDAAAVRIEVEFSGKSAPSYRKLFARLPKKVTVLYLVPDETLAGLIEGVAKDFPQVFVAKIAPALGPDGSVQIWEEQVLDALDRAFEMPCLLGEDAQLEACVQPGVFWLFRAPDPVPLTVLQKVPNNQKERKKRRAHQSQRRTPKPASATQPHPQAPVTPQPKPTPKTSSSPGPARQAPPRPEPAPKSKPKPQTQPPAAAIAPAPAAAPSPLLPAVGPAEKPSPVPCPEPKPAPPAPRVPAALDPTQTPRLAAESTPPPPPVEPAQEPSPEPRPAPKPAPPTRPKPTAPAPVSPAHPGVNIPPPLIPDKPVREPVPVPKPEPKPEPHAQPEPASSAPVSAPLPAVEPAPPPMPPESALAPEEPCPFVLPPRHNKTPFDDGTDEWEEEQLRLHAQRKAGQNPDS